MGRSSPWAMSRVVGDAMMINEAAERQLDMRNCRRPRALDSLVAAAPSDHRLPTHVRNRSNEPERDNDHWISSLATTTTMCSSPTLIPAQEPEDRGDAPRDRRSRAGRLELQSPELRAHVPGRSPERSRQNAGGAPDHVQSLLRRGGFNRSATRRPTGFTRTAHRPETGSGATPML